MMRSRRFPFRTPLVVAALLLAAGEPQLAAAQATSPDIDVTLIERTPRYNYDATKNSPAAGDSVKFLGHMVNWGASALPAVAYRWQIDGVTVATGTATGLSAGEERVITQPWVWVSGHHRVKFTADPDNLLGEANLTNNELEDRTDAIIAGFWVEQSVYNYFHQYQAALGIGANSWQDWIQRQMRTQNELCAGAIWPNTPDGVLDRVRIDKIVVVPDGTLPLHGGAATNNPDALDKTVDLMWGFPAVQLPPASTFYADHATLSLDNPFYVETSLIHELGHARYLIDSYGFDVHNIASHGGYDSVQIWEGSVYVGGSAYMPYLAFGEVLHYNTNGGVMSGPYGFHWSPYEAGALNRIAGRRATCGNANAPCNIGVYLQDLPQNNHVRFVDGSGAPRAGASVRIYRATSGPGWYGKTFDNIVDAEYTTDADGYAHMPRNPFTGGSALQHTYGIVNGIMIVRVAHAGGVWYRFVEASDFNMQYWQGNTNDAYYTIQLVGGSLVTHSIRGSLTGPAGALAGVVLRPLPAAGTGGPVTTDSSGAYTLAVGSDWAGTVQPEHPSLLFAPLSRPYANLTQDVTGQDYAGALPTAATFNGWQMNQRDMQHTGRADFTVPAERMNRSFFDMFHWQVPTPDSPFDGGLGATSMVFADGAGPGGADIVVGGYHWPKGLQGMDRHTGGVFWTGLTDGGEAVGDRSAAFSPGGQSVYFTNDATIFGQYPNGRPLMAFGTTTGPGTFRDNGADSLPLRLEMVNPVVAPDGRIFLHGWTDSPCAATDNGTALQKTWQAQTRLQCLGNDAALFQEGSLLRVFMGSEYGVFACWDGTAGAELWRATTPMIVATATVDPATGKVYAPAGNQDISVVGLSRLGQPLWDQVAKPCYAYTGSNDPQRAFSAGCLSHDGQTFYFQANGLNGPGSLYAINTATGAVKWSYTTGATGWDEPSVSSPIVTRNGIVILGNNNAGGTYFALHDEGDHARVLDSLVVDGAGNARASATLSADGCLYLPLRTTWAVRGGGLDPSGQVENLFCSLDLARTDSVVSVPGLVSANLSLLRNHPNPFPRRTTLRFGIASNGPVRLAIYDVAGRLIRTLVDGAMTAGNHEAAWDGRDQSGSDAGPGAYFARLDAGGRKQTVRLSLVQ